MAVYINDKNWKNILSALIDAGHLPEGADQEPVEPEVPKAPAWPRLRVELDRRRAGKTATIISGFDPADPRAATLAADLKRRLAVGGSVRGGEILIQGDHVDAVRRYIDELKRKQQ